LAWCEFVDDFDKLRLSKKSVDKLLTRRQVGRIFNPPLELSILGVMMAD
jgi:hypothetical protein